MIRLVDLQDKLIWRGNVFRVRGKFPYEDCVDFMVFETQFEDRPYGLIVTSGYKAGLVLLYLPEESNSPQGGVNKEWVVSNWNKWIYPDCEVSDVFFIDKYDVTRSNGVGFG